MNVLRIDGRPYRVETLDPDPRVARLAWRVHLWDGSDFYDVHLDTDDGEFHCTCRDYIVRRANKDRRGCKHIKLLRKFAATKGG